MVSHLPFATGPFSPAMVDIMLGYKKDSAFFRLYYPTEEKLDTEEQRSKWLSWLPDESYLDGIAKVLLIYKFFLKIAFWWTDDTKIPALYGAKPKITEPLKLIVMSHGLGGNRFLYSNVCCELASRGFLVAALEHRDHSACHTFYYASQSDAEEDKKTPIEFRHVKFGKDHYPRRNEQIKTKSHECVQVLDFFKNVRGGRNVMDATPTHKNRKIDFKLEQLMGKLDLDSFGIMGHSFGAATALYTLANVAELRYAVLLDPWMFPIKNESLREKLAGRPVIFINTQTFHIAANVRAMAEFANKENVEMYTIKHTTHENQTDSALLVGCWLNWFMRKLDPLLALKINNALVLKFLNRHLKCPADVSDCLELLESEKENVEEGLTKPWA
ncbi:platelet-activating factor acetylhydrolase-like [Anthonomus grandis grandis]|uniref:platelet-activating factor acetylhydrolase-like n=1 Tax=Anthonomus grandis grandis TaxID=2921223 RepID=UPI00216543F3|nr:platelet-activating factor acetylhydrolase-like [Anthonomus grandis grandis]